MTGPMDAWLYAVAVLLALAAVGIGAVLVLAWQRWIGPVLWAGLAKNVLAGLAGLLLAALLW